MNVLCPTHLFASRGGYRTVAAGVDLSAAERSELEIFGFGQVSDRAEQEKLRRRPAAFGRRLRSGRFAITRILPGDDDDGGRPTLELRSIVLDPAVYRGVVAGGLGHLLGDESTWSNSAFLEGGEIDVPADGRERLEATALHRRIADAWIADRGPRAKVIRLGRDAPVLDFAALLAPEDLATYRWGVGLLSTSVPADVVTTQPGITSSGRRGMADCRTSGPWRHPQLQHLPDRGPWPPLARALDLASRAAVTGLPPTARPLEGGSGRTRRDTGRTLRRASLAAVVAMIVVGGVVAIALLIERRSGQSEDLVDPSIVAAASPDGTSHPGTPSPGKSRPDADRDSRPANDPNAADAPADAADVGVSPPSPASSTGPSRGTDPRDEASASSTPTVSAPQRPGVGSRPSGRLKSPGNTESTDGTGDAIGDDVAIETVTGEESSTGASGTSDATKGGEPDPTRTTAPIGGRSSGPCDCPDEVLEIRMPGRRSADGTSTWEYRGELETLRGHLDTLKQVSDDVMEFRSKNRQDAKAEVERIVEDLKDVSDFIRGISGDAVWESLPGLGELVELDGHVKTKILSQLEDESKQDAYLTRIVELQTKFRGIADPTRLLDRWSEHIARLDAWLTELQLESCLSSGEDRDPADRVCRLGVFIRSIVANTQVLVEGDWPPNDNYESWKVEVRIGVLQAAIRRHMPTTNRPREIDALIGRINKRMFRPGELENQKLSPTHRRALEEALGLANDGDVRPFENLDASALWECVSGAVGER